MKKIIFIILFGFSFLGMKGQFYNGLQMSFGKNRVQYKKFTWRYYHYDNYDVYFYERGYNLGKYAAMNISGVIHQMESFFGVSLNERIMFVIYNKLSDFRQSNVGLKTGNVDFNTGGKMQLQENKVFVYFSGDHQRFLVQIRKVIAKLFLQQILYGSAFKDRITTSAMLNVPKWFEDGLISYLSKPYDIDVFNKTKDLIERKRHINFNHLTNEEAGYIGHSFWYFIKDTYGEDIISNLLYFSKVSKSIKNATYFVMGKTLKELSQEWRNYYQKNLQIKNNKLPKPANEIKVTKKKRIYQELKISPDGKNIAYVQNFEGKYKVYLYNIKTKKKKRLYKEGHRLAQIVDLSYPVLAWNYSGKILAFTTEKKGNVYLWLYYLDKKELKSSILPYISKVNSFDFSPQGAYIVFSAVSNGFSDLFVFNLLAGKMNRISYDLADDLDPKFNKNSTKIIFSSNRTTDTLKHVYDYDKEAKLSDNFDLYVYNFKTESNVLTRLTNTHFSNEKEPINIGQNKYIYLSDYSGIENRYALKFDSTISFIDTTVHYRFFSKSFPISNYSRNILTQDAKRNNLGEIIYDNAKYRLFESKFPVHNIQKLKTNLAMTFFAKKNIKQQEYILQEKKKLEKRKQLVQEKLDSLRPVFAKRINSPDSSFININYYIFDIEKDTLFRQYYKEQNKTKKGRRDTSEFPQMRVYHKTFYLGNVISQVDFSMLNQSYQPFTGSAFQFNPGMSYYTAFKLNELFDDYKLIGGFRFSFNGSMEYLLSIQDLSKRLDKQFIFHRQVLKVRGNSDYYPPEIGKTKTNEFMFILRYPFNQVASVKFSLIEKYDRNIVLSTDYNTLVYPDTFRVFSGAKLEYIFDNTRKLSTNLYDGIKFKIFSEFYQQVQGRYDNTAVIGGDFRFYKNIFHNMIFASRIGGSTSFGTGKVIFYLGGVDNWVNLSFFDPKKNTYFDKSVNINYKQNYLFQAVGTNMRGFAQNIRNGNSFIVMNNELRIPFVQMLMPYPINSDFWHNLQVVAFFDIGSAWAGTSPYDKKNLYNTIVTQRNPFTVIVDVDRPPYVYGYGFGLRSKLLGYFFRLDWAWGVEGTYNHGKKFYFSLSKDF